VRDPETQTFLFADLAGFTALTEAHGDAEAAELVEDFSRRVQEMLTDHDAEQVKEIGDAVMLRVRAADQAIRLGLRVVHDVGRRHEFPAVRVGMHTGPAVERRGDWFGTTVNLAARVAGAASGCEVLLTATTKQAAGPLPGVSFRDRGEERFKNITAAVRIYGAQPESPLASGEWPIDPVCRMAVDPARSAGTLIHRGVEYRFCSLECAGRFAREPEQFATGLQGG
jgi:class 3 adenylate cyclase/YHS domain-containing protein